MLNCKSERERERNWACLFEMVFSPAEGVIVTVISAVGHVLLMIVEGDRDSVEPITITLAFCGRPSAISPSPQADGSLRRLPTI